jgi:hypothetical protein
MAQIIVPIAADADDGDEINGTSWSIATGGQTQRIGYVPGQSEYYSPGWRFTGITIPAGATIDSATITVREINYQNGGSLTTTLYGWDTNNPAVFDSTNRPSVVTKTTANVSWTFNATTNLSTTFNTPDIKTIIQELLDSYTMSSSSIALMAIATASGGDAVFEDYSHANTNHAILTIDYTAGAAESTGGAFPRWRSVRR